jgi:hypothetical protein
MNHRIIAAVVATLLVSPLVAGARGHVSIGIGIGVPSYYGSGYYGPGRGYYGPRYYGPSYYGPSYYYGPEYYGPSYYYAPPPTVIYETPAPVAAPLQQAPANTRAGQRARC